MKIAAFDSNNRLLAELRGKTPAAQVDSGATLVKKEDPERPEIRELLFPDIQQYLKGH